MSDLNNVLHCIAHKIVRSNEDHEDFKNIEDSVHTELQYQVGEHVIAFWLDSANRKRWYLGVVESVIKMALPLEGGKDRLFFLQL